MYTPDTNIRARVATAVNRLPLPEFNEPYLGPCFEQIIGAAYSLEMADHFGICSRDLTHYHDDVRVKLPSLFNGSLDTFGAANSPFVTWVSGFYFNSAIQRLTWAGDRLMAIFACLAPTCCTEYSQTSLPTTLVGYQPRLHWPEILDRVNDRLLHRCFQNSQRIHRYVHLLQPKPVYRAETDAVTEHNYLCAIRFDVNESKHSIGGFIRRSAGKAQLGPWGKLGQDKQFEFAVMALDALAEVYAGMDELYFQRRFFGNHAA